MMAPKEEPLIHCPMTSDEMEAWLKQDYVQAHLAHCDAKARASRIEAALEYTTTQRAAEEAINAFNEAHKDETIEVKPEYIRDPFFRRNDPRR